MSFMSYEPFVTFPAGINSPAVPTNRTNNAGLRTASIFDWDNTLCPTTWLFAKKLLSPMDFPHGGMNLYNNNKMDILAALDIKICELVVRARSTGPVFITCKNPSGWMEVIIRKFFPRFEQILRSPFGSGITIFSPPRPLHSIEEKLVWKRSVVASICTEYLYSNDTRHQLADPIQGRFNFLAVGSSEIDRLAALQMSRVAPHSVVKNLIFISKPTPQECHQQIETLLLSFNQIVESYYPLNLTLIKESSVSKSFMLW